MKMEIWSGRSSDGMFRIRISDTAANVYFVEVEMTPANFALMLSNMAVECEGEVFNINRIGKTRVREERKVIYTEKDTDRATIRKWLLETQKEEGWEMNDTLAAQSSVGYDHKNGHHIIRYTVEKWV
jgi:hypothetical protein